MNTAQFYIKKNGSFVKLDGNAVFPFRWGELLDERLDEAYLNTRKSTEESYKPTSIIKGVLSDGTNTREEYFALARDGSVHFPNWSQTFKHDMYLIELTKLWEGILCPSMTFTNQLGNNYTRIRKRAYVSISPNDVPFQGFNSITSPVSEDDTLTVPSVQTMGEIFASEQSDASGITYAFSWTGSNPGQRSTLSIYADNDTIISATTEGYTLMPSDLIEHQSIRYVYTIITQSVIGYSAHTVTFELSIVRDTIPTKPWTVTDCITRIFECCEPLRKGESPRYRLDGVEYIGGNLVYYDQEYDVKYRPGSEAEKYDKVYIPDNLSMTQCTLREALKVVGSLIHAEPWLDADNVAHFKPYGSTEASGLASKTPVYDSFSNDINQYATEVRSNAQNLISTLGYASGTIYDPSRYLHKSVRPTTMYGRVEEGSSVAKADHKMYTVEAVQCGLIAGGTNWAITPCDITPYIFEATEYNANLSSFGGGYPYSKSWAIYYTIGGDTLDGLFFKNPSAIGDEWQRFAITNILGACNVDNLTVSDIDSLVTAHPENLVFQIVYKPLSSQMVAHGKQEYVKGETPYVQISNQSENLIESDWYGENLKGVSARLGNVERERTYIVKSLNDIPEVGQMLDGYAISAVSVEMMPYFFKVGVGLTKDFNRISEYVGISSAKRFYEVSERDTYNRDILLREFLIIGKVPDGYSNTGKLFNDIKGIRDVFTGGTGHNQPLTLARVITREGGTSEPLWDNFYPVIPRALGNAITLTFAARDNFSAGETLVHETSNGITGWWGSDARYTDFYGRAYWAQIDLYSGKEYATIAEMNQARIFPVPDPAISANLPIPTVSTGDKYHRLRKDNREIISYTLELEIKTTVPGLNVGSGLAKLCRMVTVQEGAVKPHLYYSKVPINKFDTTINTFDTVSYVDAGEVIASRMLSDGTFYLDGSTEPPPVDNARYLGWIIAMPSTVIEEKYSDDNGMTVTAKKYTGGEVLMSRGMEFIRTATYSPSYILSDVNFYVE